MVTVEVKVEAWLSVSAGVGQSCERTRLQCKIPSARSRAGTSPWPVETRTGRTPDSSDVDGGEVVVVEAMAGREKKC